MESAVIDKDKTAELEQADEAKVELAKPESSEWVIRRPKRKIVTEEEALKWTESFAAERKDSFIAAIRKSRSEPCAEAHGYTAQTPQNTASRGWEQDDS